MFHQYVFDYVFVITKNFTIVIISWMQITLQLFYQDFGCNTLFKLVIFMLLVQDSFC